MAPPAEVPARGGIAITFERCSYTVKVTLDDKPLNALSALKRKSQLKPKVIMEDVTASCPPGDVLAILGPSGAGKTTLLNMITLKKKGGAPVGVVKLNGHPLTLSLLERHCAYVEQHDALWASLTPHDHLRFAFELYQPALPAAERAAAIGALVDELGLTDSLHVKAGNQFSRGLSGGLKRRLSIALALAKQPGVMFLDEPTTGVDSASAAMIMRFLKVRVTTV